VGSREQVIERSSSASEEKERKIKIRGIGFSFLDRSLRLTNCSSGPTKITYEPTQIENLNLSDTYHSLSSSSPPFDSTQPSVDLPLFSVSSAHSQICISGTKCSAPSFHRLRLEKEKFLKPSLNSLFDATRQLSRHSKTG
jgi:hypothetical protein